MKQSVLSDLLIASYSGEWGAEKGAELTPVLRTANFNVDGSLDYDTPAFRCIPPRKVEAKRLQRGDILLEKSGGTPNRALGIMAYYDRDDLALCSNFNQVLRFDKAKSNPLYMFYQLRWLRERGAFAPYTNKTTGLQNLQMKAFMRLLLKVPEMQEQDRVAETIQLIDLACKKYNSMAIVFDRLVKSRFVEMFGLEEAWANPSWPVVRVIDVIEKPQSGEWGNEDLTGDGIKVLRTANFTDRGVLDYSDVVTRDIPAKKMAAKGLRYGDILIEKSGGSDKKPVGRVVLFTGADNEYLNNNFTAVLRVKPDSEIHHQYLFTRLFIDYWRDGTRRFEGKTTGLHNLKLNEYLSFTEIPIPPYDLQESFAAFVSQVDKSRFAVQQAIEQLETLKASLMQEFFG